MASSYVANTTQLSVLMTMAIHNQTKANIAVKRPRIECFRMKDCAYVTLEKVYEIPELILLYLQLLFYGKCQ